MEPLQVVLVCVKTCSSCCIIDSSCKWALGSCWLASFVNQHWCGQEHQSPCAGVSQPAYFNIPFFTGNIFLKDAISFLFLSEMVSSTHLIYSYHSHFHFHIDSLPRQSEGATQVPARNSAACARGNAPGQRRQDQASSHRFFSRSDFYSRAMKCISFIKCIHSTAFRSLNPLWPICKSAGRSSSRVAALNSKTWR